VPERTSDRLVSQASPKRYPDRSERLVPRATPAVSGVSDRLLAMKVATTQSDPGGAVSANGRVANMGRRFASRATLVLVAGSKASRDLRWGECRVDVGAFRVERPAELGAVGMMVGLPCLVVPVTGGCWLVFGAVVRSLRPVGAVRERGWCLPIPQADDRGGLPRRKGTRGKPAVAL
jgi:hypothetical protein